MQRLLGGLRWTRLLMTEVFAKYGFQFPPAPRGRYLDGVTDYWLPRNVDVRIAVKLAWSRGHPLRSITNVVRCVRWCK